MLCMWRSVLKSVYYGLTLTAFLSNFVGEFQVGVIGLVEEEWIATLSTVDTEDITFLDFVDEGHGLAKLLRQQVMFKIFVL